MMELTYDRRHNVAYLRLKPKGTDVETVRVSDQLNVDMAPDGSIYGIEFLNANDQIRGAGDSRIVLIDPVSGEERSLVVA
jgi:uncharacterized protein YuzE